MKDDTMGLNPRYALGKGGMVAPKLPFQGSAFELDASSLGCADFVKFAEPMLSVGTFGQHTILPQVQSTRSAFVGLFNAVVLGLETLMHPKVGTLTLADQ